MRYSPGIGREPSFKRLAVTSLILHVILLSALIVPFRTGEREFRSYQVKLIDPGRAYDRGREQEARRTEQRIPPKKNVVREEPVSKKEISRKKEAPVKKAIEEKARPVTENSAEKIAREIEKLRAIREIARGKDERDRSQEIEIIRKRVSADTGGGAGIPGIGENLDPNSYYAIITDKIWSEWVWPDLGSERYEVIISIKIDSGGRVVSHSIEKPSGNMLFDHSAVKAISKASPLPPPPVEMEIGVRFYL